MTRFEDMTVTGLSPLELTRTGDADPLPFEPDTLVDPDMFQLDDRVRCEITNNGQVIVHGVANGVDIGPTIESIVDAAVASAIALVCPVGTVAWMPRATAPTGWLLLDGSTKLIADYPDLFDVIGDYVFATGTTFDLPNAKGRALVGYDSAQTEFNGMFKRGGEKTHTLTTAEIPSHQHNIGYVRSTTTSTGGSGVRISFDSATSNYNSDAAGGGGAHNNLQPYLTMNAFIKY